MLQTYHDDCDVVALNAHIKDIRGVAPEDLHRTAYKTVFIFHCLLLCSMQRAVDSLKAVVKYAVAIVLPPSLSSVINGMLVDEDGGFVAPHKSMLHRARFTADVAFMLWWRERNHQERENGGCVRYGQMDSSPQGGEDLELMQRFVKPQAISG